MSRIKRDITDNISKNLPDDVIALLVGARQVGKTTILKQLYENLREEQTFFINLEDPQYLSLLNLHPKNLFKIINVDFNRKAYIFIDEIQYLDNPTNFLKLLYDEYQGAIKLIVSGSSAFYIDEKFKDSLAGRKKIFEVRTLSFKEFLRFKQHEELGEFLPSTLPGEKPPAAIPLQVRNEIETFYDEYLIYGGYPRVVLADLEEKKNTLQELAYSYIKKDVHEAGVKHEETFFKLLKIFAGQVGGLVNANELARTLGAAKTTIDNYLYVMRKSFHVAALKPFFGSVRKELTKMPKVYFYDTGLRNFFYGDFLPPISRPDLGMLLENAVFRQLLDKLNNLDEIKFWRTIQKHEIDFVVAGKLAFEVKVRSQKFSAKKYKQFTENYPQIPLSAVAYHAFVEKGCFADFEI